MLRRKFVAFLDGELPPGEKERLEHHLAGCAECRSLLERIREGRRLVLEIDPLELRGVLRPPDYRALSESAGDVHSGRRGWARLGRAWSSALTAPHLVRILVAIVILQTALLAVTNRRILFGAREHPPAEAAGLDFGRFPVLAIPEFSSNTLPHIAAEGYVSEIRLDAEEKTLHFKLAETSREQEPFVVCEIINPARMPVPREGSRVRVYGVSRYDAQQGRQWHEINPVLNIDVLKY